MDQRPLISNVHRRTGPTRNQTWIAISVVIIVALDICILADILKSRVDSCSSQVPDSTICPAGDENDWIDRDSRCFRAAVFENNRIDTEDYGEGLQKNLALFDRVAKIASQNGAKMIVFPEDGILIGVKRLLEPHLQEIPDPTLLVDENNNPCLEPDKFGNSPILSNLSCIARKNKLYLIANFGTKQTCKPGEQVGDRVCPEKGFFALNTDVVLDPEGRYIRRYRKYNLFIEVFDHPPTLEEVHFDTPYGRFGLFTCFDMVFERPAIELVEKHNVDTILFPTWWYDEAPMLTATLSQDAWSLANRVNLLAANIFRRELGSIGSGIYSGNSSIYTSASSNSAKLLIANVASKPGSDGCNERGFNPISIEIDTGYPVQNYNYKNYELQKSDTVFTLQQLEAKKTICSGQVCCKIDYKVNPNSTALVEKLSKMVLIARDANRLGMFNFYEQVCLLATLEKPFDPDHLNKTQYAIEPLVGFDRLSMKGTFETRHVFPFAGYRISQPIERHRRNFECHELSKLISCEQTLKIGDSEQVSLEEKEIYSFGLYGRVYKRDIMPEGWKW